MKGKHTIVSSLAMLMLASTFAGCSGDGGGGSAAVPTISIGTMAKGSVIVNGVRFEDHAAMIIADDAMMTPAFLRDGMTVKVKGMLNSDGLTGVAEMIKVENEVRGPITSIGADSLVVLGQTILVDSSTRFEDAAGLAALRPNDMIEVHGRRDASGNIGATRIELLGPEAEDELRGVVSEKNDAASTFMIGGLLITFNESTKIVPQGAAFENGDLVEVRLGDGNVAGRIVIEDLAEVELQPAEGQKLEVEGFVSGFTGHPGTFMVDGQQVATASDTRFRGGAGEDLADNLKVEAEGHMSGGILMADKITFKASLRIESTVETASGAERPTSLTALGKTVMITSATDVHNLSLPIAAGDGVKIRGFINPDGSITAIRIDPRDPVDPDRHLLRGPVGSFDAAAATLVVAGITIDVSGIGAIETEDADELAGSLDQLFASLTPDQTIVKARGSFTGGVLTADKLELEGRR